MGASRRGLVRAALVLVVTCSVVVAGCASIGTDTAGDEEPTVADEPADNGLSDDDSKVNESSDSLSDVGDSEDASEESPDTDGAPNEPSRSENTETNVSETDVEGEGNLEIHTIDVGQGDATLLIGPEETMLIDLGDWRDDGE